MSKPIKLLARIRQADHKAETIPPGWFTVDEWAAKWRLSRAQASRYVRAGMLAGVMQRRVYRRQLTDGRPYPISHYAENHPTRTP